MNNKGKFITGFGLGIIAGIASKLIYDNKDNLSQIYSGTKDEINTFVDHASERAGEYTKYACEQINTIKEKAKDASKTILKNAQKLEEEFEEELEEEIEEATNKGIDITEEE